MKSAAGAVRIYGIRHHGPGSARALMAALAQQPPDILLVEGPPEADALVELAAHAEMQPPVALLLYAAEDSSRAVFYPFAEFSPEWQALQYANRAAIPLRFFDLPAAVNLAAQEAAANPAQQDEAGPPPAPTDPLDHYAQLAGYPDGESWWDAMIESRQHAQALFDTVLAAMRDLREHVPPASGARALREARREAAMRQHIRAAQKEGFQQIAVVCGAWHAPALCDLPPAKQDAALLKDLPKCKVMATWIPWNYQRLSMESGYGAGIVSPGWYEFLFAQRANPAGEYAPQLVERWMSHVAAVLRQHDLPASTAEVIDAVNLARALALLQERSEAGLQECNQAAAAVLCMGAETPLQWVRQELIVGQRMGSVPLATPAAPIARDLAACQKSLRLKVSADHQDLELDLRKENDVERSRLLHRLQLLDVPWGKPGQGGGGRGTFRESWRLCWEPEFALRVIEAGRYGQTVAAAAAARAQELALAAQDLPTLGALLSDLMLCDLQEALPALLQSLDALAARTADQSHLLLTLPPLLHALRYGDVRGQHQRWQGQLEVLCRSMLARIAVGLCGACRHINADAARQLLGGIVKVQQALAVAQNDEFDTAWRQTLNSLAQDRAVQPLLCGRANRLLHDCAALPLDILAQRLALALSDPQPEHGADWIEGLLADSALLLLHDEALWRILDNWLSALDGAHFTAVLPLLRRAFANFAPAELAQIGQLAAQGARAPAAAPQVWHAARADALVPLARLILGGA
ncbi:DUF5682 family protein [Massilia sp. W12]|uniref:DUF5682 family protein n=1 Tax=Massilia sp. W12 TaxID=3126507 RepID=UPI0030D0EEB0